MQFDPGHLTSFHFIHSYEAAFSKAKRSQILPSHLWGYSTCTNVRLHFHNFCSHAFDPNKQCMKNGLHSRGLNPQCLGHESSALQLDHDVLSRLGQAQTFDNQNCHSISVIIAFPCKIKFFHHTFFIKSNILLFKLIFADFILSLCYDNFYSNFLIMLYLLVPFSYSHFNVI